MRVRFRCHGVLESVCVRNDEGLNVAAAAVAWGQGGQSPSNVALQGYCKPSAMRCTVCILHPLHLNRVWHT